MNSACPFCSPRPDLVFHEGEQVLGLWDAFPVSTGHALLVTRRHVASWFDATAAERAELTNAIHLIQATIRQRSDADAFNIGINVGAAAGQTVPHLHVHVIPRELGDVEDPRGGVRHVIPGRGNYLTSQVVDPVPVACDRGDLLSTGGGRPLFPLLASDLASAEQLDVAVAFVSVSGVERVYDHLSDLLERGGRLRLLTGDYLDITDPDALTQLLDLSTAHPSAKVEFRIYESRGTSFHPKTYVVKRRSGDGVAYVGSSNLSRSALEEGVEWNYRVIAERDASGFIEISRAFDSLLHSAATRPLDAEWVARYRARRRPPLASGLVDAVAEPFLPPPEPNQVQVEALAALTRTRREGFTAGLVVMATGLGKTWLSAFDSDRSEFSRILFVAHREEILEQAMRTFRRVRPRASFGFYDGEEKRADADIVFASVQTLARRNHLLGFDAGEFDYIVVDEFHHAAAQSYRRLLDHFRPKFLLGLTATPERTDGGDLLALCQENLVYRRDLPEGIRLGLLSPFHYFGVPDDVDYSNIPWRSARFDEEALTLAVATQRRAQNALEQWRKHGGGRTLAFCVSQRHANFMRDFFRENGVRAAAVHSGEGSDPRAESVEGLTAGAIAVLFAVDVFNEGVDVPAIETVLMLRPTESQILWLQQIGRGLRKLEGKLLKIIDYIGNHRVFLVKVRTLLQLGPGNDAAIAAALAKVERGEWDLPPGCLVTYDLRSIEILRGLLRTTRPADALRDYYLDFRERLGTRPLAVEAFHDQYSPRSTHATAGSWLGFVNDMGDLEPSAQAAFKAGRDLLRALEVTPMTKSYKMVVLSALLEAKAFPKPGLTMVDLVDRVRSIAERNPLIVSDFGDTLRSDELLSALLEEHPLKAWTGGRGTGGIPQFEYEGGVFRALVSLGEDLHAPLSVLAREIVDWRLAEYLARPGIQDTAGAFTMSVSHSAGRPILFLPDRDRHPEIPSGWQPVVIDGHEFLANFVKVAVNVVSASREGENELPALMRSWFGASAGLPGTRNEVLAEPTADGRWVLRPANGARAPELISWTSYAREQIPPLFGDTFSEAIWNAGFVVRPTEQPKRMFLLVTLDKSQMHDADFKYVDRFTSPDRLQWHSQNRTSQSSKHGTLIREHLKKGVEAHLFVRPEKRGPKNSAAPFIYCGQVTFESWSGDKPITVAWRLREPVPDRLRLLFQVPPKQ